MTQQQTILAFIQNYIQTNGNSPTRREIATGCGLSSTSVVTYHLNQMVRAGLIEIMPNTARGIKLAPFREEAKSGPLAHLGKVRQIVERVLISNGHLTEGEQLEEIRRAALHLALAQQYVELKVKPATVK